MNRTKLYETNAYKAYLKMRNDLYRTREALKSRGKVLLGDSSSTARIIYIGMAEYNNIGDVAISYASLEFLKTMSISRNVIALTENEFLGNIRYLRKNIHQNDLIILQGGGNISDLYPDQQNIRRKVLKYFAQNNIIIFPQSVYFSDTPRGRKEQKKTFSLFNSCRFLTVIARERKSFDLLISEKCQVQTLLVPDIVFSLKRINKNKTRDKIITVFRNDKERCIDNNQTEKLARICKEKFPDCNMVSLDTVIDHNVYKKDYFEEIQWYIDVFSEAKFILTDRLHALILSYLSFTPCLAFDNLTGKVERTYNWIKECPEIKIVKDNDNFDDILNEILKLPVDLTFKIDEHFDILRDIIEENTCGEK